MSTATPDTSLAVAPLLMPDSIAPLPDVLPSDIEREVRLCNADVPHDVVAAVIDKVAALKQRAADVHKMLYAGPLKEWIEVHGPVRIGTKRWQLARESETKCKDNKTTFNTVFDEQAGDIKALFMAKLDSTGGDVDAAFDETLKHVRRHIDLTVEHLSSQPYKHGGIKKLLPEPKFKACFDVKVRTFVDEKGETKPAPKTVQVFDDAFAR